MTDSPLRIRSFAKINVALAVLGKRPDGYHNIQTIFQSISLYDELEFHLADQLELRCENLPGVPQENNLVWKAANKLSATVPGNPGASIMLKKRIPSGAGLGGGSSNAAATLLGLCRLWRINASESDLRAISAELGSDIPFFLSGGTAMGSGRGERIDPIPDLPVGHLVVIYPGMQVSTAEAYSSLNLGLTSLTEDNRIHGFRGRIQKEQDFLTGIFNDFETSILPAYPLIREAKEFLRLHGAVANLMSGSGSAVFGFFSDEESALAVSRMKVRDNWQVFPAKTLSSTEYFHSMFG